MPSDLPPNESPKPGAAGSPGPEALDERPDAADAAGRSTDRTAPSGFNAADLRRYAAQTHANAGGKSSQSSISNSFALAMIVAFVVIAVVMVREGPGLVTPARVLPNGVAVPASAPAAVPATSTATSASARNQPAVARDTPVARAFGVSTLEQISRQVRRVGQASALAAECGVATHAWVNDVRDVLAKDFSERYPAFDDTARTKLLLKQFAAAEYTVGQQGARQVIAEQGKETACANIRYSPDYRTAVNAAQQAGLR